MGGTGSSSGWALPLAVAAAAGAAAMCLHASSSAVEDPREEADVARERELRTELARSEEARVKAEKLRHEERTGRTRAEQRIREISARLPPDANVGASSGGRRRQTTDKLSSGAMPSRASRRTKQMPTFTYQAIGEIASCFVERNGCPRQGKIVPSSRAWLQLRGDINPAGCTDGLNEYTHLQIIFVFHANTNEGGGDSAARFKAKIAPPRLTGSRKVGTLATRSPHRPNPIGLTTARIEGVDAAKGRVLLSGLDLLDGTPVLDIKPYIPEYDCIPEAVVPDWVREPTGTIAMSAVRWADGAKERLAIAAARDSGRALRTLPDIASVSAVAEEVLAWDVRTAVKRRRDGTGDEEAARHKIVLDGLEIHFRIIEERVVEIVDFVATHSRPKPEAGKERELERLASAPSKAAVPGAASAAAVAAAKAVVPAPQVPVLTVNGGSSAIEVLSQPPAALAAAVNGRTGGAMAWLVLGDGDFSFSLALALALGGCVGDRSAASGVILVATSLDSEADLVLKYGPGMHETLAKLRELGATVLHGVDATKLVPTLSERLPDGILPPAAADSSGESGVLRARFDRVTFQFPLCGATLSKAAFEAAAVPAELRNRNLIQETLRGGCELLKPDGELIVTAKPDNKYDMRFFCTPPAAPADSSETAKEEVEALVFAVQWPFEISQYPGYTPRNVETNESFPIANSPSFAFVHAARLAALGIEASEGSPESLAEGVHGMAFACEKCGVTCSGEGAYNDHCKGSKHRRNLALERKWEAFEQRKKQGIRGQDVLLSSRG